MRDTSGNILKKYRMGKIGLFYSFKSKKTAKIAGIIHNAFSGIDVQLVNVDEVHKEHFLEFDQMIFGVPTWFDGELPNYWDELLPALEEVDFTHKKLPVAVIAPPTDNKFVPFQVKLAPVSLTADPVVA